jgi:prevent-host-death family protein
MVTRRTSRDAPAQIVRMDATRFIRKIGQNMQRAVLDEEIIVVTRHRRLVVVLMSIREYDRLRNGDGTST